MKNWWGGRNGYMDQSDEYQPSSGYKFERSVCDRVLLSRPYRTPQWSLSIKVELNVDESCSRTYPYKSRVSGWRMYLIVDGCHTWIRLASGKATSLQSAIRQADTWLANNDPTADGIAWFYDRNETTTVIDGDVELVTFFRASSDGYMSLPQGEYLLVRADNEKLSLGRWGNVCSYGSLIARDRNPDAMSQGKE